MSSGGMPAVSPGNNQDLQVQQDIVIAINNLAGSLGNGVYIARSFGHNASGATGTCFTADGDVEVLFVQVSSTNGADAVTLNLNVAATTLTHNIITDGVIGAAYPLYVPGPFGLSAGDTITYAGADADCDFITTYREKVT